MFGVSRLGVAYVDVDAKGEEVVVEEREAAAADAANTSAALISGNGAGGGRFSASIPVMLIALTSPPAVVNVTSPAPVPSPSPRPERRVRLSAAISWRSAKFSDLDDPSSVRMASRSLSRSAMSPSSVDMYSV